MTTHRKRRVKIAPKPLVAIDLFAGAGGATQGLADAGYDVLAAIENDAAAANTYAANHPAVQLCVKDIRDIEPRVLLKGLGRRPGEVTLLKACPPCQAFSTLGKNESGDDRNELVLQVWRFISGIRPRCFLLENVPGLRRDARLRLIKRRARAIGYGVREYVVDAAEFGVPQRRRRLIVMGVYGKSCRAMPTCLVEALPASFDRSRRTAGDALAEAAQLSEATDPVHRHRRLRDATLRRIRLIPVGGSRFDLPRRYQLQCHKNLGARHATASYGRIRLGEPAPTLTSRCTTPACGAFVHPRKNRGITLREAALLQCFPLAYQFHGSYGQIEKQIGNALPVRLAEGLGRVMARVLKE